MRKFIKLINAFLYMRIEKKIWPAYFEKVAQGTKTFEIRLADFECNPGDILQLKEWDPEMKRYTGRMIEKTVTHVSRTKNLPFWSQKEIEKQGLQIIGFR